MKETEYGKRRLWRVGEYFGAVSGIYKIMDGCDWLNEVSRGSPAWQEMDFCEFCKLFLKFRAAGGRKI